MSEAKYKGQVVLLEGGLIGSVKYVGPLPDSGETYVGVKLGEGSGDCDGSFKGKRFFDAPQNKGVFATLGQIKSVIKPEQLLGKVVKLNKKVKQQKVRISELTDELTLFKNNPVPNMSNGTDQSADVNDQSDSGIAKFLDAEISKRWYISLPDLQSRFDQREPRDVAKAYANYENKFNELPECQPHNRIVYSVCASQRDNLIGSGSDDKTIRLWRRRDEKLFCVTCLTLRSCINSLAISPNGSTLAAALDSGWIELYDLGTGKMIGALEGQTASEVWTICFSNDGGSIISGALDRAVRIWDVRERECRWALRGHDEWVNGVSVSPDGSSIVSGSGDKTVRVWDTKTMTCRQTLRGHSDFVRSVAVLPDNKTVVSASDDCCLRVWDIAGGNENCINVLKGHSKGIYSVAAGNGNTIASASRDATVKIWNTSGSKPLKSYNSHRGDVNSCTFFEKGGWVASGSDDKTVRIYKID